jgi:hypothetical protein
MPLVCFGFVLSVLWQEANRIAVKMMREAGVAILDLHALTHGREDRSHDGTHYWNQVVALLFLCHVWARGRADGLSKYCLSYFSRQKILHETASKVRKGNGVSATCTQLLLNWLCNG